MYLPDSSKGRSGYTSNIMNLACSFHILGVLLLTFNLFRLSYGAVDFYRISNSTVKEVVGTNVSLVWNYTASNRNIDFKSSSPIWLFEKNGTELQIAFEYQFTNPPWTWTISNECPQQFLNPTRIHKEQVATLVITNVTLLDSGKYTCKLELASGQTLSSFVQLYVEAPPIPQPPKKEPVITKAPESKKYTTNDKVTIECTADGNPEPSISWKIKKTSREPQPPKPPISSKLIITPKKDAGEYICIATNSLGSNSSDPAILQYTECDSGCSSFSFKFEILGLDCTREYKIQSSEIYKNATKKIEKDCFRVYREYSPKTHIYSCVVRGFSCGSIVAELKVTHPKNVTNPKKPLEEEIAKKKFAGYDVKPHIDKDQNDDNGGLPDWVIAVISVAVIIVVVGIVALIIWRVKKKKDKRKGLRIPMS